MRSSHALRISPTSESARGAWLSHSITQFDNYYDGTPVGILTESRNNCGLVNFLYDGILFSPDVTDMTL